MEAAAPPIATPFWTWPKAVSVLVLATVCAYAGSFTGQFLLDDDYWIVNNPRIGDFWEFIQAWPSRPVIAVTLSGNYQLHGLHRPGYHFVNLATHIAAGLVLFSLIRRTMLFPRWNGSYEKTALPFALAAAAIWLLHPLQTQAVTYVIQRCESLMGLFYLLVIYALCRYAESSRPWTWTIAAIFCLTLGLRSKEPMMTAPLLALIFDRIFLAESWRELLQKRLVFHVSLWVFTVSTLYANVVRVEHAVAFENRYTPRQYFLTQPEVILHYIGLFFWPLNQVLDYHDWPPVENLEDFWLAGSILGLLGLATLYGLCRRHWFGFLGSWFYIILAPTSSFAPIDDMAFEHRLYLSLAALAIFVVAVGRGVGIWVVAQFEPGSDFRKSLLLSRALGGTAITVCVVLGVMTFERNLDYLDRRRIWQDVVDKRPNNERGYINLGNALNQEQKTDEARKVFEAGLKVNDPTGKHRLAPLLYISLGTVELIDHHFDRAEKLLEIGRKGAPGEIRGPVNLGILYIKKDNQAGAREMFAKAVELKPNDAANQFNHATASDLPENFVKGLELDPEFPSKINRAAKGILLDPTKNDAFHHRHGVFLAKQALMRETAEVPGYWETYAFGLALLERFDEAKRAADIGLKYAREQKNADWAQVLEKRVAEYARKQKPRVGL